jgi:hypothetical protein
MVALEATRLKNCLLETAGIHTSLARVHSVWSVFCGILSRAY